MFRTPLAIALAAAVSACAATPSDEPIATTTPTTAVAEVTGSVVWRERIMLPPSTVKIQLLDVSLADAPAKVLAEQIIEGVQAPPVTFKLSFDPKDIQQGHRYTVSARVEVDGQLRFISDTHNPVITNGVKEVEVLVKGVGR